jgi:hypothetical protein
MKSENEIQTEISILERDIAEREQLIEDDEHTPLTEKIIEKTYRKIQTLKWVLEKQ